MSGHRCILTQNQTRKIEIGKNCSPEPKKLFTLFTYRPRFRTENLHLCSSLVLHGGNGISTRAHSRFAGTGIADLPNLTLAWKMHQSNTEKRWSKVLPSDAPQVWFGYTRTRNWKYMATQVYQRQWAGRSSTSWPKHGPCMQNTFIEHAWSTKISCRRHRCALSDFIFFIMNQPENTSILASFSLICTLF